MGRIIAISIVIGGLATGAAFYALLKDATQMKKQAILKIQTEFLTKTYKDGDWIVENTNIPRQSWHFELKDEHLEVQAPEIPKSANREQIRQAIEQSIAASISNNAKSSKPAIVEVHFAND